MVQLVRAFSDVSFAFTPLTSSSSRGCASQTLQDVPESGRSDVQIELNRRELIGLLWYIDWNDVFEDNAAVRPHSFLMSPSAVPQVGVHVSPAPLLLIYGRLLSLWRASSKVLLSRHTREFLHFRLFPPVDSRGLLMRRTDPPPWPAV